MIAVIRFCYRWELSALFPVEVSAVNNDATEGCPVATDELCCRMNHDVSTVLDRTKQVGGGCEGVVYHERYLMAMG